LVDLNIIKTNKLTELIGDLTVFDFNIDFKEKIVTFNLGYLPFVEKNIIKNIRFENVVWQDFSGFHRENIQNHIIYSNDFNYFLQNKKEYIEGNTHYFPNDLLKNLNDNQYHYYYFEPTSGFSSLIITQTEIIISNL